MTNEAKVGAFTLIGLALLAVILFHMSDIRLFGGKDYTLYIGFDEAVGVNPSAEVRFAGVLVGRVRSVETDGMGALVTAEIRPDIHIPRTSRISISSSGFLSEKFIGILPGKDTGDYLTDGEYVYGVGEQTMDSILGSMNKLMEEVHGMVASMNHVLGSKDLQHSLVDTAVNVRDITANMRDLTGAFAQMAGENRADVSAMVKHLNVVARNLADTTGEVERMVAEFSGDGQTAANLRLTIANLSATSQRIERMAASVEGVVTDPKTAEDVKALLHNARSVSERADRLMGGLGDAAVTTGVEAMYSGKDSDWRANFDVEVAPSPDRFLRLGFDGIGADNRFNAQVGRRRGGLTTRFGLVDSRVGLGVDADAGSRWRFSLEAYDLNDVALKAKVRYRLGESTYLFSQVNQLNDREKRTAYVGVRQEF
ncbi:MAG: MlaD family protein [Schwartzia sp. (in: firmicutes)]